MMGELRREEGRTAPRRGLSRDLIARAFDSTMRRRRTEPKPPPCDLGGLLDCLEEACAHAETVTGQAVMDQIGQRSFGALILLPAIIVVSPLSGIFGVPSVAALLIIAVAGQLMLGRHDVRIPQRVAQRALPCRRVHQAMRVLRPMARVIDRILRPRLTLLTAGAASRAIAAACILLAMVMPPLEMLPFASSLIAGVVALFGLALLANDGAMAVLGYLGLAGLAGAGLYLLV
ncbi:exopolysaccharide biosynthesis protein [Pseudoroseomonas cervicalis]|uniref:Exopolysaccharide synthesis, ExoD n=1 Tax=Pseudoroseomonas cervicalis ATCC 49957 TaxID=525371 RepID=D5RRI2_9PROT|nr:exopolysaccharide biosynthesis protein [Pseudoroseomonas cervicalis]EFH10090.1 exopolysaccharide synthesis, ExoD [Pseudoroseomonas cervicalis ATCC 49957]